MRVILAAMSDSHAGYTLGLMNPDIELQDENDDGSITTYTPEPTSSQVRLWNKYTDCIYNIRELAGRSPIIFLHDGDITHGDKYPSQLVSTRPADQIFIALANQDPWMEIKNIAYYRFATGTDAHAFKEATSEGLVVNTLQRQFPKKDIKLHKHDCFTVGDTGVTVDYAHHGPPPGSRPHLLGDSPRRYLRDICTRCVARGKVPPRIIIRGHYHTFVEETVVTEVGGEYYTSTIVLLPSFTMPTNHTIQALRSLGETHIGMVAFEINNSAVTIHRLIDRVDLVAREAMFNVNN